MGKSVKNIVKQFLIISESAGKQDDLYNHTKYITDNIIKFINGYVEKYGDSMSDGDTWEFTIPKIVTKEITEKTLISGIKTKVEFTYSSINKIKGSFDRVKLMDDGSYTTFLTIMVNINKDINDFRDNIESLISHELHHAFRTIKTINKNSKSDKLNIVKNKVNLFKKDVLRDYPELKVFMDMVYLSLPQEVEARQQETATQLKNCKSNSVENTIHCLQQHQPINDARKMYNYDVKTLLTIDKDVLVDFIKSFNEISNELNIKGFNNHEEFFNKWVKHVNNSGLTLLKKIMRMVSDKHMVDENTLYNNNYLLKEVFGLI
jgi:hypothetical protein